MLCPFHYFGISDVSLIDDKEIKARKLFDADFNLLTGDQRVAHNLEQANYNGYNGEHVKDLISCNQID